MKSPSGRYSKKRNISNYSWFAQFKQILKSHPFNCIHYPNVSVFKCLITIVPLPEKNCSVNSISWWIVREFGIIIQLIGNYMIDMALHLFSIWIILVICMLYACMLLHWLNWHDPQALGQASPYFLQLHRSVRHAVVHWQWMTFSRFCGAGSCSVITGNRMFFASAKRQPQSVASIPSSYPIHVMIWRYVLSEWYFIAPDVGGSFSGLTNALEIIFLVSTLLRRECSDWPSLPPTSATMAFCPISAMSSILWFCLQNCTAQFTGTGSTLINFWIKGFFPIPYMRDVVSHPVKAWANRRCFETSLPNTLLRTLISYTLVYFDVSDLK